MGVVLDSVYVRKDFRQTSQMTAMATGIEQRRRGIKTPPLLPVVKKARYNSFR
jgi:hypothetical protein